MRTPLFVFGIALALVAFLVMFAFGIVFVGRTQASGTIQVVVAKADIGAREPISPDMLALTAMPASAVPPNAFLHMSDVSGQAAVVDIFKGEAISRNLIQSDPDALPSAGISPTLPIPAGYVALTVPTSDLQGVGGYVAQGDYIDVIAAVNTSVFSPLNPRVVSRTVFTDLHVIRVGPQSIVQKQGQGQGVASSLTVVMTLCDAQYMDWLLLNATVKYALRSYHDNGQQPADSTCPSTSGPSLVGPSAIEERWGFAKG